MQKSPFAQQDGIPVKALTVLRWAGRKKRQKRKAKAAAERQGTETSTGDDVLHVPSDPDEAGSQPLADVAAFRQDQSASEKSAGHQSDPVPPGSQQDSASLHAASNDDDSQPGTQPLPKRSPTSRQASAQLLSSQTSASPDRAAAAAAAEALGRLSAKVAASVLRAAQSKAGSPAGTDRSKNDSASSDQAAQQHARRLQYTAVEALSGSATPTEAARSPSPAPSSVSSLADDGASQFLVSTQASQFITSSDIIKQRSHADPREAQEPDDEDEESSIDEQSSVWANSEAFA